jgi:hypothetical protein
MTCVCWVEDGRGVGCIIYHFPLYYSDEDMVTFFLYLYFM